MKLNELNKLIGHNTGFRTPRDREQFLNAMRQHKLDCNAFYQKIEMTSPYVNTHRDINYANEQMPLHSHPFYEIVCCRSTCGAEYLIGSNRYVIQKGDILLVRPGTSHCVILPEHMSIPYERDLIWISEAYLSRIKALLGVTHDSPSSTFLTRTAGTPWEYLCDLIHNGVLEEEKKQDAWETAVLGNTIQVLAHLYRARHSQQRIDLKVEKADLLDEIIGYIEDHYSDKIVMRDLAKHFFISERTISTLFRQRLGTTFGQFLTQRRLIAAKTRISEGNTLEDAAEQAGFADYSTFYRAFRKEFGISPNTFKNQDTV